MALMDSLLEYAEGDDGEPWHAACRLWVEVLCLLAFGSS